MQQGFWDEEKKPLPKSIYKSACQKNIRRGNVDSALRCAKANIEQDAHDFSRRVMILAPEEVSIHPLMPAVASINKRLSKKGQVATDTDKDIMLSIVRDCAEATKRDLWEYGEETKFILTKDMFDYFAKWQQDILMALRYRGSIGGMKGDIKMCNDMVNYLSEKWSNGEDYGYSIFFDKDKLAELVDNKSISMPTIEDIPYFAVDFHCFPPISKLCLGKPSWVNGIKTTEPTEYKKFIDSVKNDMDVPVKSVRAGDTDDDEWVKKVMWFYESSISYKTDYSTGKIIDERDDFTENDRAILDKAHSILVPIWQDIVEWYLGKYNIGVL